MNPFLYALYSFFGTLGFGIIFNIKGKNLFFAALSGFISWFIYLFSLNKGLSPYLSFFYASIVVATFSEAMARLLKSPVTVFIICGILPLVPGSGMYYTMLETTRGNINKSLSKGLDTLIVAGAIAVGIVLVSSIFRLIFYTKNK